jgi:hypothetical protein
MADKVEKIDPTADKIVNEQPSKANLKKDDVTLPNEEVVDLDQLIKGMQDVYATRGPPKKAKDFLSFEPEEAEE